jgi:GAF domain-containing protein
MRLAWRTASAPWATPRSEREERSGRRPTVGLVPDRRDPDASGTPLPVIDPDRLRTALDHLLSSSFTDVSVEVPLRQAIASMVAVFDVEGAGLMFMADDDALRYAAASDASAHVLERAQEELGCGPCVDSLINDELVSTPDLAADERWPGLAVIVVPAGVRAVLGVPVHLGGGAVGSLNVYYGRPHIWQDSEIDALASFNTVVEGIVGGAVLAHRQERLVSQLQHALDHRVAVERAIGVVMARDQVGAVEAFNRLRRAARSGRRRVSDVADELLASLPR